jgi:hypothetical protein
MCGKQAMAQVLLTPSDGGRAGAHCDIFQRYHIARRIHDSPCTAGALSALLFSLSRIQKAAQIKTLLIKNTDFCFIEISSSCL